MMPNDNTILFLIFIVMVAALYPAWHLIRRAYRRIILLHTGMDTDLDMDDWRSFYKQEKHTLLPNHILGLAQEAAAIEGYSENFKALLGLIRQRFENRIQIGHLIWIWEMVKLGDDAVKMIEVSDVPDFNEVGSE